MSKVQLKDVYNGMKNVGWSVPDTYEKFEKYMTSGPNGGYDHRKEVYDKMKGAGWSVPNTYEQFSKSLFAPTKSASGGGAGSHSALARPQNRDAAGARFKTPMPKILDKGLDGAFGGDTGTGAVGGAGTGAASGDKVFENPDEATYIFPNSYKKEAAKRVVEYRKRGYDDASIERKLELEGLTDAQIKNRLELDWARSFDDGTKAGKELSQKLVAAHFHKRLSDINALHFGDGGSASAGNGHGAGSNVNGHDRGGNGGVGADDVAAKTWEQALTRVNAEVGRFDELTGGVPSLTASAMPRAGLTEVSRMREFDLNRLMDDHWANLGESGQKSYIADCKRYLMEIGRDAELIEAFEAGTAGKGYSKVALNAMVSRQLDKEAEALAREQSDIHMFEYAKKQNLPKGKLEFLARKIASANTAVQLTKGLARAVTGHSGDMAASEAAMAEYGSEHGVLDLAGMVGGMTADPVTWVSGSVGGGASKAVVNLVGKRMAGKGASSLARNAAARQFGASLKGSLVAGVSGGGTNFALFEGLNEAKNQFMHGGHVVAGGENDDIRTQLMGKNEGYSLESIGKQMVYGAVMGGVGIGWLHPVSGNVSDKLVRGLISGTFGKMVTRAGVFTGATVLEGTIFSVPEWLEGERDKWDVWKGNMAMMAAFKFKPAAKAVGHVAIEAGSEAVYSAAKRLGKIGSTPQGRASMETRLRTWLDRPSMPMSLTADERKELRDGGYDFSHLLQGVESEAQLREHGASNAGKGLADRDGADNGRDTRGAELTKELQRLVDDGSISESARAKMYYYATGNFLPVSTIGYGESVENGDGTYTVRSYGENGVVTSRTFKSERAARLELGRVERQAEMNQVSVGEQNVLAEERDKRLEGAMRKVAAKKGMSITSFANLLDGPEDASKDTAEAKEVRKQIWREISEELKGMPLPRLNRVEEIRHGVEVKCGAQVYEALAKEPERRSERERRVVSEYIRELQHVEDVVERAVAGGADNAEVAESEVRPMGKARARIGIEYADVEVLSGDVVLDASGGIDRDKSSKTVVVRDLRDGRKLTVETKKLSEYSPAEKMEGKESGSENGFVEEGNTKASTVNEHADGAENDEPQSIGQGIFGKIYDAFKGRVYEAVNFLFRKGSGEAKGVFHREEIGEIDLIWGDDKGGLQHIINKHVIEHSDFESVQEAVDKISNIIKEGEVADFDDRVLIVKDGYKVVLARTEDGRFVLTAYDNNRKQRDKKRTEADATEIRQRIYGGGMAHLVSSGLDSDNSVNPVVARKDNKKEGVSQSFGEFLGQPVAEGVALHGSIRLPLGEGGEDVVCTLTGTVADSAERAAELSHETGQRIDVGDVEVYVSGSDGMVFVKPEFLREKGSDFRPTRQYLEAVAQRQAADEASRSALAHPQNRDAIENGGGRENRDAAGESKSEKNGEEVSESDGKGLTLQEIEKTQADGNGPEQNNDESAESSGDDGGSVAGDSAGGVASNRDRGHIRVYEEGLEASYNEHSGDGERARRNTEGERLIGIAKEQGEFKDKDEIDSLGERKDKRGGESEVFIDRENGKVYKVKDPYAKSPMKGNVQPEDAVFEHLVHNKYFPETAYGFEGVSEELGDVRIVLSQDYVEAVDKATDEQVAAALAEKGLYSEGKYRYGNDEVSVTDVTGDNALVGADGKVYFIDPIIDFKKPVREILGDKPVREKESALSRIPVDRKGKPDFAAAESAELGFEGMVEMYGDGAAELAESAAQRKEAALKKERAAKVKPPKLGDDATDADYLDAEAEGLRQKKERVAALEEDARRWRAIADVPKSRAEAEKAAVEKAEAEKAEVGRRANEEAQARRRASARKIMVKRVTAEEYAGPKLSDEKDYYGKPLVLSKNGTVDFGVIDYESGLTEAPIRLSLGENRKDSEGKNHGYGLLHIEAGHGEQIRNAGYSSVEEFVEDVAKNYTDIREGAKIGDNQTYLLEVSDEHNNTLFIQMSRDGSYWNVNSAGIFKKKYSRRKPKVYDRPAVSNGKGTDTIEVNSGHTKGATAPAGNSSETSEYKDNIKNSEKQAEFEKAAAEELADREAKAKLDKLVRHVFDEVKDVPEALERLEQTSIPEDIYEVAAMVLSRYKLLARSNDGSKGVMADTGIGEGERKRLFRMFMPKENGGKSLGWLAGDAMKELCEQYGIHYDNQDAHNALIEMLQNAKVPSDIYNYIVNNRIEEARKIAGDYHDYIAGLEDAWCQETFGMSREEYMEMREVQEEEARKALEDLDYDEYNAILAEEKLREEEYEQRRFEQVDPSAEGEGSGGGGTLLPDQGTDKQGVGGGIAQEPGSGSVAVGEGVGDAQGLPESSSGRGSLSKESGEGDGPKYRGGDAELAHGVRLAVHHEGDEWWVDVPGYEGRATSRKDMMDSLRARFPQYGFVPTLDGKGVVVNHPDKPVANGSDVVLSHGQELRVEPAGEPRAGYDGKPHYMQCTHPLLPGRVFDGVYELAGALEASFPGWRAEAWPDGRISMWHVQDLDRGRAEKAASAGRGVGSRGFERGRMLANAIGRTHSMAQRLGLPVDYVMSEELPEGELRGKKGWYDPKTGRITVVVDNHGGEGGDLLRTLLHEGVGHRGLRAMFGEHFDDFLDAVYENGDDYVHSRIDEYMRGEGGDRRRATEEYLATLAEDNHVSQPWIRRVCKLFFEMLDSVGLLRVAKGVTLSDADLRYLLWRSHQNLVREAAREDVSVRDAEMQRKLGLDRPDIAGDMESAGGDVKLPGSHVESIASEPSLFDAEQSSLFAPEDFGISESKVVKGDASDGMASGGRPSASHSTKADGKALAGASDGNGKGDGMARARISELARGDNEGPLDYAARVSAEYEAALDSERDAEIRADVERMELDLAERVPEDPDEVRGEIGELQSMWEELAFRHGEEPQNEEVRELMGSIETAIATRKRIDFVLAEGGGSASEEASRSALTQPQNRDATGGGNIMPSSEVNKTDGVGKDGVGKEGVGGSGSKAGGSGGIDDWGEEIYGARKNALRDLSKQLSGVTAADLVANPVSKVFKPKDWVKLAAKGEITAEDARVLEAMTRLILRDKKPSGLSRNRYASRRREEEIKAWAERTAKLMDGLRRYAEAGTAEDRAAALESMDMRDMEAMRDRRAQVLEWNPDRKDGGHYEPNELETVIDIMDGMDVPATPFGKAKLPSIGVDSFGSRFEVSLDGKYKRSFGSYEEALAYSVKLAKVSRGDMDVEYMPEDFVPYVTSYKEKELDTWSVMYLTGRRGDFAFKDGLSEAEATKLKANLEKKGVACNMRHEKVNEPTGWKLRVRDPLSGERYEIEGCPEFADKSEASAWLDANIGDIQEKANAAVSSAYAPKEKVERHLNLEIGYDRESGTYDVWLPLKKKTAYGNMLTFARGFATRKEAAEWIERNRAEIDAWDAARKEARRNFRYFTPGNVREGRDWRSGKDVSEREVGETFGFRGVQFGNWTNQRDRQQAVNEAYDALMDLADVLGVSPKAIGLGGELGLAFGARGSGNANAHYERDNVVINLTKTRGAGSLAHEWWHALDNYYSRRGGIKTGMMTDGASAEVRAEMGRAFRGLVEAISGSDYDARSRDMGSYWGSPVEETARLFAEWVHMKLKDNGRRNSFLSNGLESSDAERWQQMTYGLYKQRMKMVNADIARANEKLKDGEKKPELEVMSFEQWQKERESLADYPYPTEAELRERFNEPMQRLVDTMEEKSEGDGSVVLYRLGDPRETFAERQKKAVENRGTVMPGLNEAEVEVIEVPRHGYRGTAVEAKNQAVKDAKQRFDGKVFTYNNNGIRFEYTISGSSLDKTMSRSSIQNSANMGVHIAVLNSIDKVIGASIEVEEHPDYIKDNNGQRKITNDINPELLIHRFVGAVKIDGRLYSVRTVIKEYRNTRSQANYYTYEVSDVRIEAQPSKESRTSAGVPKSETPSLASAKVTKESDTSNRQGLNFDDESGSSEEAINIEVSEGKPSDTSTGSGRLPKESPGRTANLEKESEISKQNLEKSLVEGDKKDVRAKVRVADLINDLGKTYDSGKKILEESRKADAEEASRSALTQPQNRDAASEDMHRDVNAEGSPSESLEGRRARAEELSDRFGVGVEVVSSLEELRESEFYKGLSRSERRALERRKGAYDPRTGRVIVLAHNHRDADDVSETVFHEVVAHKGLRELVGKERFSEFCDEVYGHLRKGLRKEVDGMATRLFMDSLGTEGAMTIDEARRVAVDELFGRLAEKGFEDFTAEERGVWGKLKQSVLNAINRFLGTMGLPKWVRLGDNELRYILWRSHENLREGDYVDKARDIAKREELGLGDGLRYSETKEERQLREVNDRFNQHLEKLAKGEMANGELKLGRPGETLRNAGIDGEGIYLQWNVLQKKMNPNYKHNHPFLPEDVKNLPEALNNPIAVFESTGHGDFNILVDLEKDGKNFIVSLEARRKATRGGEIEIEDVVTLYPKEEKGIIYWINRGLGKVYDKEKALQWLRTCETHNRHSANEELRDAAKIIENFENPKGSEKKIGDGLRYSETKEERQLREVNDRFNSELEKQSRGELAEGHIYKMGKPGDVLLGTGVPDVPIQMNAARLLFKATQAGHDFELNEVKDLVYLLQEPVAVFSYGDPKKAQNVILEINQHGKNFVVGMSLKPTVKGKVLEINSVRTVYPKDNHEWLKWIQDGNLLYVDKERIQPILAQQRMTFADVAKIGLDLGSVAKIIENFENPKGSEGKIRFRDGDEVDGGVSKDALDGFDERKLGLRERITNAEILLSILNEGNVSYRKAAVESIRKNLGTLRSAMAAQKRYDWVTVKQVTDLAQVLIKNGYMDGLRGREVRDLLTAVRNATGKDDISAQVHRVMEIMVDSQLREGENLLHKVLKIKAQKVDKDGIVKQGAVDADTADMLRTYKLWRTSDIEKIDAEIAAVSHELAKLKEERKEREEAAKSQRKGAASEEETSEKGNVEKKSVAEENLEKELEGLMHAYFHADKIVRLEKEEARMRREMREAEESYSRGDMTLEKRREFKKNAKEAIWENKIARIEAYAEEAARIGEMTARGRERALAFREAERERVGRIRHMANSDMEGRSERIHNKKAQKLKQWMVNNTFSRFIFAPLSSFDMMLRTFGKRSVDGEGYLWNHFMGGWKASRDKEISGHMAKMEELDVFVKSLTGDKRARWSSLIKLARNKGCEVDFLDGKEKRTEELTQGNLMYIYMANKMVDGKMKLRKMGIGETDVERISEKLDPTLKKAADWLQEEFLPGTREEYNETHKRMFGTSMDDIENYFPLRILGESLQEKGGVDDSDSIKISNGAGATKTGAINRRTVNAKPLDILNSDATHIILDHIQEMEHWNAFAEWGRDVNTLLSDTKFRAKVKNMTTMYGAGDTLWKEFKDCCRLAAGTYRPEVDAVNRGLMNIAKGATGSAVAGRLYTAMKQLTSWPAYIGECNPIDLAKSTATSWKSLSWAMENVPMIRERWKSRVAGDPRLSKLGTDWKLWEKKIPKFISQYGMLPNAAVDVWTVAVGAKAMYDTAFRRYKNEGYSKEEAHRRAIEKAETYNETQQSDEGAYLSPMQRGGNYLSNLFTIFRNSPFSYTRKTARAARNLGKYGRKGEWERDLEFERKKILRDLGYQGLEDAPQEAIAKAGEAAKKRMVRQLVTDMVNLSVFGLGLSYVWNLGGSAWYLLFGEDGKKKDEMWDDAWIRLVTAPVEGLTGGDMISNVAASLIKGESLRGKTGKSLPFEEELSDIIAELTSEDGMKVPEGINHLVNLAAMTGLGINPRTIEEMVMGIWDGCHGDLGLANGVAITIGRFMNVAPSQLKNMYIDEVGLTGEEASKMSPKEIAELYAARQIARERFITFKWDDQEALARYEKIADKRIKERMESFTPEDLEARFEEADERYTSIRRSQTEARKILDEDNDYMSYGRAMAGIQREAGDDWHRLELYGQLDRELTKTTKAYLKTRDSGEAQELRKRIDDIKERISRLPDMPVEEAMMESLKIKGERQVESAWENMLKRSAMAEAGWEW